MTSHKELKVVGRNCTYYVANSLISSIGAETPTSCTTCSNWSGAKCLIGVYDSIKNIVNSKDLL